MLLGKWLEKAIPMRSQTEMKNRLLGTEKVNLLIKRQELGWTRSCSDVLCWQVAPFPWNVPSKMLEERSKWFKDRIVSQKWRWLKVFESAQSWVSFLNRSEELFIYTLGRSVDPQIRSLLSHSRMTPGHFGACWSLRTWGADCC